MSKKNRNKNLRSLVLGSLNKENKPIVQPESEQENNFLGSSNVTFNNSSNNDTNMDEKEIMKEAVQENTENNTSAMEQANVLKEKEEALRKREEKLVSAEKALEKERQELKKKLVDEIKNDEQSIREEEYQQLKEQWRSEEQEKKSAFCKELDGRSEEFDKAFNEFYLKIIDEKKLAIKLKSDELAELSKAIVEERQKFEAECQATRLKLKEEQEDLKNKQRELATEKEKLAAEREDFEDDQEDYREMREIERERNKKYSPGKIETLQNQLDELQEIYNLTLQEIDAKNKKIAKFEVDRVSHMGQSAVSRIAELEEQLAKMTEKLDVYANYPSIERIKELEDCEAMGVIQKDELNKTKASLVTLQQQLNTYMVDKRELENARTISTALQSLNDQLQEKLSYITEQYKNNHESKFKGLLEIDKETYADDVRQRRPLFSGTLANLVSYIRNYGATFGAGWDNHKTSNPLYYSEETIRVFLASLAASAPSSRLIILQGLSGTGKSSLSELFKYALGIQWYSIAVQPSWRDNRELLGYDNDFTNRFKETEFTKAVYRASTHLYDNDIVLIVLDEVNLARIEYYFADFLSELEHRNAEWKIPLISNYVEPNEEQRPMALQYTNGTANLVIKKNVWFIGTANNDDSTSLITDKVYDRAQILDMDTREPSFRALTVRPVYLDLHTLQTLFAKAQANGQYQMTASDWQKLDELDSLGLKPMEVTFGNRMKKQLEDFVPVYVACGGTKEGAIDYYLSHKILRKLDERYDMSLTTKLDELISALEIQYPDAKFTMTTAKIKTIKEHNLT